MSDLYDIGEGTVFGRAPIPRPATGLPAPPRPVVALVTHGADVCIVHAPNQRELDRVARERRLKLGLAGEPKVDSCPWEIGVETGGAT